jgi:hypothetical protein
LALRAAATLGVIDSGLDKLEDRLSKTQDDLKGLGARTLRWILIATIVVASLTVWMAAGQAALCLLGWRGLRRTQQTIVVDK